MLRTLLKEVYSLYKFKRAVKNTNIGDAARYLAAHKVASDSIEKTLATIMQDAKTEMAIQKNLINDLINEIK